MNRSVPIDDQDAPTQCPKCEGEDLCIDNVDGYECLSCGCWFDIESNGRVIWARPERPMEMF